VGEFDSVVPADGTCSCGSTYRDCAFWQEWKQASEARGIPFEIGNLDISIGNRHESSFFRDLYYHLFPRPWMDKLRDVPYAFGSTTRLRVEQIIERSVQLARVLCEIHGTQVFFDTSKDALKIPFLHNFGKTDVKMVSLVRDGRGVMNSLIRRENMTPNEAIDTWLYCNRIRVRAGRHLDAKNVFEIKLESLCRDPQTVLRQLFEFCGVNPDATLQPNESSLRHIIGNTMRFKFDGTIKLDEKWRRELTPEHLELFRERAGALNRELGYAD
jgi:hypothetical protein